MSPCLAGWLGEGAWEGCVPAGREWVTGTPPGTMPSIVPGSPPGATPTTPGGYLHKTKPVDRKVTYLESKVCTPVKPNSFTFSGSPTDLWRLPANRGGGGSSGRSLTQAHILALPSPWVNEQPIGRDHELRLPWASDRSRHCTANNTRLQKMSREPT